MSDILSIPSEYMTPPNPAMTNAELQVAVNGAIEASKVVGTGLNPLFDLLDEQVKRATQKSVLTFRGVPIENAMSDPNMTPEDAAEKLLRGEI